MTARGNARGERETQDVGRTMVSAAKTLSVVVPQRGKGSIRKPARDGDAH